MAEIASNTAQLGASSRNKSFQQQDWEHGIVMSKDSPMCASIAMIEHAAPYDISLIFTGESGTGKTLCAKSLHARSLRWHAPFLTVSCKALNENDLAKALFGVKHTNSEFAIEESECQQGLFVQADGGTLVLEDIDSMSLRLQMSLMEVLNTGLIGPAGSNTNNTANVRVLATSQINLEQAVTGGSFRDDLYYYLSTFIVHLPALRDRPNDISLITNVFLNDLMKELNKQVSGLEPRVMDRLNQYDWPGNICELQNEIRRMLVLCQSDYLAENDLSTHIRLHDPSESRQAHEQIDDRDAHTSLYEKKHTASLKERVEKMEVRIIQEALNRHQWNKTRTAKELGLSRVGLRKKLERYGLLDQETEQIEMSRT